MQYYEKFFCMTTDFIQPSFLLYIALQKWGGFFFSHRKDFLSSLTLFFLISLESFLWSISSLFLFIFTYMNIHARDEAYKRWWCVFSWIKAFIIKTSGYYYRLYSVHTIHCTYNYNCRCCCSERAQKKVWEHPMKFHLFIPKNICMYTYSWGERERGENAFRLVCVLKILCKLFRKPTCVCVCVWMCSEGIIKRQHAMEKGEWRWNCSPWVM